MFCRNCGASLDETVNTCPNCGTPVQVEQPAPAPTAEPVVYAAPQPVQPTIPEQYRPMGAWAYTGLKILFAIPVIGFIFLIIFTFKSSNLSRRSFARSYWCDLLLGVILIVVIVVLFAVLGVSLGSLEQLM